MFYFGCFEEKMRDVNAKRHRNEKQCWMEEAGTPTELIPVNVGIVCRYSVSGCTFEERYLHTDISCYSVCLSIPRISARAADHIQMTLCVTVIAQHGWVRSGSRLIPRQS